jgi:hypothetical protein
MTPSLTTQRSFITFPSASQGNVALGVGQTATPTAGSRFGIYAVNSGGRLRLNPGIYYFDRLTVESGSTLELLNSTGPRLGTHRDVFGLPLEEMTPAAFRKTLG